MSIVTIPNFIKVLLLLIVLSTPEANAENLILHFKDGSKMEISIIEEDHGEKYPIDIYFSETGHWNDDADEYISDGLAINFGGNCFLFDNISKYTILNTSSLIATPIDQKNGSCFTISHKTVTVRKYANERICVYDINGQQVACPYSESNTSVTLNLDNLSTGVYVITNGIESIKYLNR